MTLVEQELFVVLSRYFNATVDLCGCLPGNISYARKLQTTTFHCKAYKTQNPKRMYIYLKFYCVGMNASLQTQN